MIFFFAINCLNPEDFILITLLPTLNFSDFVLVNYPYLYDLLLPLTDILILITPIFNPQDELGLILIYPISEFFFDLAFTFVGVSLYLELQFDDVEKVELDYQLPNEPNNIDGCDPDNPGSPFLSEDVKIVLHVISQVFLKVVLDLFRIMVVFNSFMIF